MEFKNLADVTLLEEIPEGASVLASVDGDVVRVPGTGLGGGGNAGPTFLYGFFGDGPYPKVVCDTTFEELVNNYKNGTLGMSQLLYSDLDSPIIMNGIQISVMASGVDGEVIPSKKFFDTLGIEMPSVEIGTIGFSFFVYSPMGYQLPVMYIVCTPDGFELMQ